MKNIRGITVVQHLTKISIKTEVINFENTILFTVPFRGYTLRFYTTTKIIKTPRKILFAVFFKFWVHCIAYYPGRGNYSGSNL